MLRFRCLLIWEPKRGNSNFWRRHGIPRSCTSAQLKLTFSSLPRLFRRRRAHPRGCGQAWGVERAHGQRLLPAHGRGHGPQPARGGAGGPFCRARQDPAGAVATGGQASSRVILCRPSRLGGTVTSGRHSGARLVHGLRYSLGEDTWRGKHCDKIDQTVSY